MSTLKKILVPTDFSPCAERALAYAIELAGPGTEVVLLHVFAFPYDWYYLDIPGVESLKSGVEEDARRRLSELALSRDSPNVSIRTRLEVRSHTSRALLDVISEEKPDLAIMGTKGWRAKDCELGSVAEQFARQTDVPVLVVPASARGLGDRPAFLVPLYASEASAIALGLAGNLVERLGGRVEIFQVLHDESFGSHFLGNEPVEAGDPLESESRIRRLEKFAARNLGPDVPFAVHLAEGEFAEDVAGFVENEGVDMVVIARSGAVGRPHKAELVARKVACPVLIVPTGRTSTRETVTASSFAHPAAEAQP